MLLVLGVHDVRDKIIQNIHYFSVDYSENDMQAICFVAVTIVGETIIIDVIIVFA